MVSTLQKINLTEEYQKILGTPTAFYDYLKEKYLIEEKIPQHEPFLKHMVIRLPSFKGNTDKELEWNVILEKDVDAEVDNGERYLVFGADNIGGSSWSRLVQLQSSLHQHLRGNGEYYAQCRHKIIANDLFEKSHENHFYAVVSFLNLMLEFLRQY